MRSEKKQTRLYALIDCNNFFASCERVFRPDLTTRPVAVLSNNDGCIVARSNEIKQLGIPMAAPYFKWREVLDEAKAVIFSANFALYSDISKRIIAIFEDESPEVEVYSVDESFVLLEMRPELAYKWAVKIKNRVFKDVGVPVSIGLAPSKTLAKAAAEYAKKHPEEEGVSMIASVDSEEYQKILGWLPVGDVWGVGRRLGPRLIRGGIYSGLALSQVTTRWANKQMTIKGEQMVRELKGEACFGLNEQDSEKQKSMLVSRSFSKDVRNLSELEVAVASYVASLAHKLRKHQQLAAGIGVFAITSYHKDNFTRVGGETILDTPTSDNVLLTKGALRELEKSFRPGINYKKAGVYVNELVGLDGRQMNLFSGVTARALSKEIRRGEMFEKLEGRWGRGVIKSGAALGKPLKPGEVEAWRSLSTLRSQEYTTKWTEIPTIAAS